MNGVLGFHNVVLGSSRKGRKVVFFDNFMGIVRVFVVGSLAYVTLIVLLRFSGNRTLSKMNAFDFIVTVALGSTLATILFSWS